MQQARNRVQTPSLWKSIFLLNTGQFRVSGASSILPAARQVFIEFSLRMALSVAGSFILGTIAYGFFLGLAVAGLVTYNIWNNKSLQKARKAQEIKRCRDSLMDALNEKDLWRDSKATLISTLAEAIPDTPVESQDRFSKLSFDDSLSIDTKLSLSTVKSAGSHNSREESERRFPALSLQAEHNRPRNLDVSYLSMEDVSALSDADIEDLMKRSISVYHGDNDNGSTIQDTETEKDKAVKNK